MRCPATGAPGVFGKVKWEKVDGELPYAYSIRQDILYLKDVKRTDEGVYRCIVRTDSGLATVTHVHLKVSGIFLCCAFPAVFARKCTNCKYMLRKKN